MSQVPGIIDFRRMKKILALILCATLNTFAQSVEKRNEGKEPHKREAFGIDELLKKNDPKAYKAMTSQTPFIVVANYRNGKRWRYFEGDVLRFKTRDGKYFEEDLAYIEDSTFSIYKYNAAADRMEYLSFHTDEISAVYKYKRGGVWKTGLLSMGPFLPMALLDWGLYNNKPWQNGDFLWIAPIVGAGNILIFKHKNLFNKQTLRNNKALKIIKPN